MRNKTHFRRIIAFLLALPLLLSAVPSAQAEKKMSGTVRVLLTRLNLTDRAEISLDGSAICMAFLYAVFISGNSPRRCSSFTRHSGASSRLNTFPCMT